MFSERVKSIGVALLLVAAAGACAAVTAAAATVTPFDKGWKFLKADVSGAEAPTFDDAAWRAVDLPHDRSIEGPFDAKNSTGGDTNRASSSRAGFSRPRRPDGIPRHGRGAEAAAFELRTAGKPAKVQLSVDRQQLRRDWDDVALVIATVVDADGIPVPNADPLVTFKVNGPGAILAVDNADNASHEPFQASERKAFQGWCIAVLRGTGAGQITVTASAAGLTASSIAVRGD